MTGVLVGQSDDAALLLRRQFHISCQKTWLSTLQLRKLLSNLSEADAQVEEARHTAQLLKSVADLNVIRGGPWCRKVRIHDDRLGVEEAHKCVSRSQVRGLMSVFPRGSLATHLKGNSYRNQIAEVPGGSGGGQKKTDMKLTAAPSTTSACSMSSQTGPKKTRKCKALLSSPSKAISAAKPPVACVAPKRKSGKRAPGKKRQSGVDGHTYRQSIHCQQRDPDYDRLKFGHDPQAVKNKARQTYRAKRNLQLQRRSCSGRSPQPTEQGAALYRRRASFSALALVSLRVRVCLGRP